jgi:hypothetical protein
MWCTEILVLGEEPSALIRCAEVNNLRRTKNKTASCHQHFYPAIMQRSPEQGTRQACSHNQPEGEVVNLRAALGYIVVSH